jgi:hypothetical protein
MQEIFKFNPMRTKKIILLCFLILLSTGSMAQDLTRAEYFFNTDPGVGKGTAISITAGEKIEQTFSIPTTGLSPGFHTLFIRFRDANRKWSITEGRTIYIQAGQQAALCNLTRAEYFFNTDPGAGKGTPLTITASADVKTSFTISTSGLQPGFHTLFIRFRNASGQWGIAEGRTLYIQSPQGQQETPLITRAEYFFNTDPGAGKAIPMTIEQGENLNTVHGISTEGLQPGFHHLFIRFMNQHNQWSITEGRTFYIPVKSSIEEVPLLSAIEYFFNEDPGAGNGLVITFNPTDAISKTFELPIGDLPVGEHLFFTRFRNENGTWSITQAQSITVTSTINTNDLVLESLKIYPNPAGNNVYVEYPVIKRITIFNSMGQKLMDKEYADVSKVMLNTDSFKSGLYVLQIITPEGLIAKPLTIAR